MLNDDRVPGHCSNIWSNLLCTGPFAHGPHKAAKTVVENKDCASGLRSGCNAAVCSLGFLPGSNKRIWVNC